MSREAIYEALFQLAATSGAFVTTGRRLRHIDEMQPAEFPALFQTQRTEGFVQTSGNLPPIPEFHVDWWIYAQNGDMAAALTTQLNPLVDAALAAMKLPPSVGGAQSLAGRIESVRLAGPIEWADGALDDRGFVRIPVVLKLLP